MTRTLRDAIAPVLDGRWSAFAEDHPHLAAAIDRVRLESTVVDRVRDDPAFREAMRRADLDEATLAAAAEALDRAERVVAAVLRF